MNRTWFESIQGPGKSCENRKGKAREPCDCKAYTPFTEVLTLTRKQKALKERQCASCGHAHVNVWCVRAFERTIAPHRTTR